MEVVSFIEHLNRINVDFFTGVPDSQLQPLCNYLITTYGISNHHIIAANEGNAVALAAGYHLSTDMIPCVYLQNSGLGNIINPVASLLNVRVYGIPCVFIVGWRGEPNVYDEPQHVFQGEITLDLLDVMDIAYMVIDKNSTEKDFAERVNEFQALLNAGKSVAFVVKKGGLSNDEKVRYENHNATLREEIIRHITDIAKEDVFVSTTGKTSRELFEIREQNGQFHKYDFLTVGSMGHSSSIALGIALNKPNTKVWCIDGDGAALMHMGAMGIIGSNAPSNMVHILINNGAHESVGGQPTVANNLDFMQIALGCGYPEAISVDNVKDLDIALNRAKSADNLIFLEVKAAIGSRKDLGRPTTTAIENKESFMAYLRKLD